jgi:hypothetical protein
MVRGNDKNFFGADTTVPARIRGAWEGRVSGCLLGKPVEVLSFKEGREGLESYLREAGAFPLRDYVPLREGTLVDQLGRECCRGFIERAEPDDDINYTVLALLLLEDRGAELRTEDVARAWLRMLPAGTTWTAERWAYRVLLDNMADEFVNGDPPGFDLALCSDNDFNEWIGAQIRADLHGWVCPGQPALAAELATRGNLHWPPSSLPATSPSRGRCNEFAEDVLADVGLRLPARRRRKSGIRGCCALQRPQPLSRAPVCRITCH